MHSTASLLGIFHWIRTRRGQLSIISFHKVEMIRSNLLFLPTSCEIYHDIFASVLCLDLGSVNIAAIGLVEVYSVHGDFRHNTQT